jgi:glycosyltransferase involved in cell wall biosynthesis
MKSATSYCPSQESAEQGFAEPPLVTVVIPAYNSARYIGETLQSVLSQEYLRLEVIVVDDGSTDNTEDAVKKFDSSRVTYLRQPNSGGPSRPRNTGIQESRGQYIALIDSDDIMLPGKLARAVRLFMREPHLGLVFTNFVKFDDGQGRYPHAFLDTYEYFWNLPKKQIAGSHYVITADAAYDGLISENYIGTSGVVVPKEVFSEVGLFDESIAGPEDFDMWLRITSLYDIGFIDIIGHCYRVRADSITTRGDKKLIPHKLRILERQLAKNLPEPLREKIRGKISKELWALGYCHQTDEEIKLARKYYVLSLKEANYWRAWKGLLVTSLGGRMIRLMKRWRDRVTGRIDAQD